ncbi:hypothetical protein N665_0761s0002 [Sinapis alba]|nr:hypothetical protein N665_0761s0002 [Sinapis alba]
MILRQNTMLITSKGEFIQSITISIRISKSLLLGMVVGTEQVKDCVIHHLMCVLIRF